MEIKHKLSWRFSSDDVDQKITVIYDLYINFETSQVCLYPKSRKWGRSHPIDPSQEYRLNIQSQAHSISSTLFEILSFDVANCNDTPLKMALAMNCTILEKISLFESAMKENPKSFTHCDEYLCCLHVEYQPEKAYDFILEYSGSKYIPMRYISSLAGFFYEDGIYEKAQKLFELIDDKSLKEYRLMAAKGYVYWKLEDLENALKYFEFCVANSEHKETISYCLGSKTKEENIHKTILLSKRALEYHPNDPIEHNNLGYYYLVRGDHLESFMHLKKSIDIQPNGKYVNGNMANLLYAMKKYDESIPFFEKSLQIGDDLKHPEVGPKCLENYANILYIRQKYERSNDLLYQLIQRNDFAQHKNKDAVYWLMSLNFEKMEI